MNYMDKVNTPEFQKKMEEAGSLAELAEVFKAEGIEIAEEDLVKLSQELQESGELNENDLDEVAGGSVIGAGVVAIKFFWGITPGKNNREKAQYIVNWWYNALKK